MNKILSFFIASLLLASSACAHDTEERRISSDGPMLISNDLSSNQSNGIPYGRLQLITYYDGVERATLRIHVKRPHDRSATWIEVSSQGFGLEIGTWEFDMLDYEPTGSFEIRDVIGNGMVDGLAFAFLWRDNQGKFRTFRSVAKHATVDAHIVGVWPLMQNLYGDAFVNVTPQMTSNFGRGQARAMILGAELLPNGKYSK